jgi:DNA-binding NarL/FixJ family response regulator
MRLIIADDHDLVRDALTTHIQRLAPDATVKGAGSVDEALAVLEAEPVTDLLILDLRMPGMNGLEGFDRVRARHPRLRVALMSGVARPDEIRAALARGAAGFVPKTLSGAELVAVIRQMLAGDVYVPPDLAAEPDGAASFTRRERDVLALLLKGLSNKEIARVLSVEEVTVKLHVRGLCRKLEAKNRTQAVMRAVELGLDR